LAASSPREKVIAVTQGPNTDMQNPASRFLLHVLGAAAEFERFEEFGVGVGLDLGQPTPPSVVNQRFGARQE
jgi:hypothetical protein